MEEEKTEKRVVAGGKIKLKGRERSGSCGNVEEILKRKWVRGNFLIVGERK